MKLTRGEKNFLKQNKQVLREIFNKIRGEWEEEMKHIRMDLPADEFKITALGFRRAITLVDDFLREIKLAETEKEREIDKNFI